MQCIIFPEPFMPWSVIQLLLHAYSGFDVSNGGAWKEGEGGIRYKACILIFFFPYRTSTHYTIGEIWIVF